MHIQKIDMTAAHAGEKFSESLRETGFAVLKNSTLPYPLVQEVIEEWKAFFASEEKLNYMLDPETQTGFYPYMMESAKGNDNPNLMEYFHVKMKTDLPPGFSGKTKQLNQHGIDLALQLAAMLERETPKDIVDQFPLPLDEMCIDSNLSTMRILHYPKLDNLGTKGSVRAAAHEDISLLSLLPAATSPGLQAKDIHGNWHNVDCDPGEVVVNAGDMLQMLTDHYYPSTTHQVVNPIDEELNVERFSVPIFVEPREAVRLSKTHTAYEYIVERLRENGVLEPHQELKFA